MTPERYGFNFGNLTITYFSLIVLIAAAVSYCMAEAAARRRRLEPGIIRQITFWAVVFALVFGRFLFVLNPPPHVAQIYDRAWYFRNLFDFLVGPLAIWSGGLERAGIVLGAILAAWIVARRRRLKLFDMVPVLGAGVMPFLVLLPLANLVNGHFYGPPTDLPWGMALTRRVPPFADLALYPPVMRFHPTPAYASLLALACLGVFLLLVRRTRLLARTAGCLTAMAYLVMGFLLEFLRVDVSRLMFGLSAVQVLAVVLLAATAVVCRDAAGANSQTEGEQPAN